MEHLESFILAVGTFFASASLFFATLAAIAASAVGSLVGFYLSAAATAEAIEWMQWQMRGVPLAWQLVVFAAITFFFVTSAALWLAMAKWGWMGGQRASRMTPQQAIQAYQLRAVLRSNRSMG
jgi:hypothetical protein